MLELPDLSLPRSVEESVDKVLARVKRLRRRVKVSLFRKMSILRSGFRDWLEDVRREDERPILKKGGVRHSGCCLSSFVVFRISRPL